MNLRRGYCLDAALNCRGRLCEPEDDRVEHGLSPLAQGGLLQLADGIRSLGDDHIRTSLGRCQTPREVGKSIGGDHHGGNATLFERGSDVATPRRARASVTSGGDDDIHASGQIVEGATQGIDQPASALRQFANRLLHDDSLHMIAF
jgi:hypothetical protein